MKNSQQPTNMIEEQYKDKSFIIDALNSYGDLSIENYSPLVISENDLTILFDLATNRLKYIKETIQFNKDENVFGTFVFFAFKALFIGKDDLKTDNLLEKIDYFNVILEYADTEEINSVLRDFINDLGKNIGKKEKELFKKQFTNDIIFFIYLLLRDNKCSLPELNEFIIRVLESSCEMQKHFDYDKLKNIPHDTIIADLYQIIFGNKITNNFHLFLKNSHLKAVKFTKLELNNNTHNKDNINNKNNLSNTDVPHKIEEKCVSQNCDDKKGDNISDMNMKQKNNSNNNSIVKSNIEKKNDKARIAEILSNAKKDSQKINDNSQLLEILLLEINNLKEENVRNKKEFDEYKKESEKKIEKSSNEISSLKNTIYELDEYKNESEKKLEKSNNEINSMKKAINDSDAKIIRIENDLNLIKLREAFKYFVEYIYCGLQLSGGRYYEEKINVIINYFKKLGYSSQQKSGNKLIESIKDFMNSLKDIIDKGNYAAHHIDFKISILDQIFSFADKNNDHDDFKKKLKNETNAEQTIRGFIENKELNFYNIDQMKSEEVIIRSRIHNLGNVLL